MRVRVRLDQQRIASLLAGISPESMGDQFADVASGVLSMLGDMASLSFARYHTGGTYSMFCVPDELQCIYMAQLHVARLSVCLKCISFCNLIAFSAWFSAGIGSPRRLCALASCSANQCSSGSTCSAGTACSFFLACFAGPLFVETSSPLQPKLCTAYQL